MSEHEEWDIGSGVGITALGIAVCRAMEAHRPDSLARDPFAESFVAASQLPEPVARRLPKVDASPEELDLLWTSMPTYVGVRTRFFDDYFDDVCAAGVRQVVLVAAGLDTRAFRLDWPDGTDLFEVDQPLVLTFKDKVLGERDAHSHCDRHIVATDLRGDWPSALRAAGFDPIRPTAWLVEGLLSFLPADAERDLFAYLGKLSAPGSWLAIDSVPGQERDRVLNSPFASAAARTPFSVASAVWQTELRPEPVDVLRAAGWLVTIERLAAAGRRYGRAVDGVMSVPAQETMLITATR